MIQKKQKQAQRHGRQQVRWRLVRAIPNLVTGESLNVGIMIERPNHGWQLLLGEYRERLEAIGTSRENLRIIEQELARLEHSIGCGQEEIQLLHLHQTGLQSMWVDPFDESWGRSLLREMVPANVC